MSICTQDERWQADRFSLDQESSWTDTQKMKIKQKHEEVSFYLCPFTEQMHGRLRDK